MSVRLPIGLSGTCFLFAATLLLRADQVQMQNGDRYFGKVLSVSADTVVLQSEVLGRINVPRKMVASLAFGTNAPAPVAATNAVHVSVPADLPAAASPGAVARTNADWSAALRELGASTNAVRQIRDQMLAGNPEAASKYDELINGLMSGTMNMSDLRRQAQSSADQLRALKRDLGSEAGDSLDAYLTVLDSFLKETAAAPSNRSPALQPKTPDH